MALELPVYEPCPYCENFEGRYEWHGPPAVIHEDETVCVFLAPRPMGGMPGHTLVTTKRHTPTVCDLTRTEEEAIGRAVGRAGRMLRAALDPDGILVTNGNGVEAFQTVPHVHFHVIPKRADSPFPPRENPGISASEDRQALARELGPRWDAEAHGTD